MGSGLVRPECVLATSSGSLYTADWRSGVAHTKASGESAFYGAHPIDGEIIKPNGIALCGDGSFLLAHLGDTCGGVFRLQRNGETQPVFTTVDGSDLPPTNFPLLDSKGRLYVTVSTRLQPRALGYRKTCNDGFIVLQDQLGARIVADGLGYTNEIAFDAKEEWLYVNETFGRRLSRFPVAADGSLGAKQVVTEFGAGVFPDGMALDVEGNVWVVSIVSNQLLCVPPDGEHWSVLSDCDPEHLRWVESAYQNNEMGRPHLDGVKSNRLRNTSSIAFGGGDMRTAFLGCLLGDSIASIAMATAGLQPLHWNYQ
ncbi:MAG: gluconolactonase [Betaproteobacteria bacterium]|nr:MAG: gluconolactonase [Betaproteobacteria bacterium]